MSKTLFLIKKKLHKTEWRGHPQNYQPSAFKKPAYKVCVASPSLPPAQPSTGKGLHRRLLLISLP